MRFRNATGHSILDEVHECRINRICDLLAHTHWPIATIIAQSGYVSSSFAQKLFQGRTGQPMHIWRKRFADAWRAPSQPPCDML